MEKKDLKWYEAPVMDALNIEVQGMVCASVQDAGGQLIPVPEDE